MIIKDNRDYIRVLLYYILVIPLLQGGGVLLRDDVKEHGNYCSMMGCILGLYRDEKMEATIV